MLDLYDMDRWFRQDKIKNEYGREEVGISLAKEKMTIWPKDDLAMCSRRSIDSPERKCLVDGG